MLALLLVNRVLLKLSGPNNTFDGWLVTSNSVPVLSGGAADGSQYMIVPRTAAVTRAVFRLLDRKATDGEIEDLQHVMPAVFLDLWPSTLRAA